MFEDGGSERLADWVSQLAALPRAVSDEQLVSRLRPLETVACAVAAAQARDAADLDASRRAQHAAAGTAAGRRGEGTASEVALARRVSPHRGAQLLGLAKVLTKEMPHAHALMTRGELSEWRATILARETACLDLEHRQAVDAELCGGEDPVAARLGDRALTAAVKKMAVTLDAASVVRRAARAASERCVAIRPAPDAMTWVSALLPVADGVGVYAALKLAADTAVSAGEPRSRGQVMADTLVHRVTGRDPLTKPIDLDLRVVLSDATLLQYRTGSVDAAPVKQHPEDQARQGIQGSPQRSPEGPAYIRGYGPVAAAWVRALVAEAVAHPDVQVWIRQLYAAPHGGLTAMASKARRAPAGLADFITLRDQTCRTPWCDAPIRHIDHVKPWRDDGPTEADNLQGLCERCNHARQAPGWEAEPDKNPQLRSASASSSASASASASASEERSASAERSASETHTGSPPIPQRHGVTITTPTGHQHRSVAPALPGCSPASQGAQGEDQPAGGIALSIPLEELETLTPEDFECLRALLLAA